MNSCDTCVVRNRAICADLGPAEIALLNGIGRRRRLDAGEPLMWEGDAAVLVANVIEGVLKLSSTTEDGKEQIVGVVYPSDFIGRPFGTSNAYGATALTEAEVCVFTRGDFEAFAREHPRLEHKLLERTLGELDRTRRAMVLLARKSAGQKVASFLLEAAERLGAPTDCAGTGERTARIPLGLSRQQIADVLGLTIETVSRQFTRLKDQGIVALPSRREVDVLDPAALRALAG